jgi:hypothetical protein
MGSIDITDEGVTMTTTIRTLVRAATVGALAAGAALGIAAAPAQAATGAHATLGVVAEGGGAYWIPVDGVFPMSKAAAQDAINHGYTVRLTLMGDDPVSDDTQYRYPAANLYAADDGLHFGRSARVPRSVVNEDDSWTDHRDELYVRAQAVAPNGATPLSVNSNTVVGNF